MGLCIIELEAYIISLLFSTPSHVLCLLCLLLYLIIAQSSNVNTQSGRLDFHPSTIKSTGLLYVYIVIYSAFIITTNHACSHYACRFYFVMKASSVRCIELICFLFKAQPWRQALRCVAVGMPCRVMFLCLCK